MTSKKRKPLFERLKKGLEEAISHAKGDLTLKTVQEPAEPPVIDGKTLAALRRQAAMSQAVFAKMLNVSPKTVQSWEQGNRKPSDASRRLIEIFSEHPEVVCRTVGLPEIKLPGVKIQTAGDGLRKIVVRTRRPNQQRRSNQKDRTN